MYMKTMLLVDDEPFTRQVFSKLIANKFPNTTIITATDGGQAWELAEQQHFDVITLDLNMPVLSGLSFLQMLRAKPETKDTPCIVVSALTTPEIQEQVKEYNAITSISKLKVSPIPSDDNAFLLAVTPYLSE